MLKDTMTLNDITILGTLWQTVVPVVGTVLGWWLGRHKQKHDFLTQLQASVDLLSEKNRELLQQLVQARYDVARLEESNARLLQRLNRLEEELPPKKNYLPNPKQKL